MTEDIKITAIGRVRFNYLYTIIKKISI